MCSTFPLLHLPDVPLRQVIKSLPPTELTNIALTNQEVRNQIRRVNLNVESFHVKMTSSYCRIHLKLFYHPKPLKWVFVDSLTGRRQKKLIDASSKVSLKLSENEFDQILIMAQGISGIFRFPVDQLLLSRIDLADFSKKDLTVFREVEYLTMKKIEQLPDGFLENRLKEVKSLKFIDCFEERGGLRNVVGFDKKYISIEDNSGKCTVEDVNSLILQWKSDSKELRQAKIQVQSKKSFLPDMVLKGIPAKKHKSSRLLKYYRFRTSPSTSIRLKCDSARDFLRDDGLPVSVLITSDIDIHIIYFLVWSPEHL